MNLRLMSTTAALLVLTSPAFADMEAARAFLDAEIGDLSSLTREEQEAEMQWFIDAAQPFQGMSIWKLQDTSQWLTAAIAVVVLIAIGVRLVSRLGGRLSLNVAALTLGVVLAFFTVRLLLPTLWVSMVSQGSL